MTGIPDEQILVALFPGLPTSAELFILPHKNTTERRKSSEADLEQVRKEGFMEHLFLSYCLQSCPWSCTALEVLNNKCGGNGCIWDCGSIVYGLKENDFQRKTRIFQYLTEICHSLPLAEILPKSVECPFYSSYGQKNLEYVLPLLPGGMLIKGGQSSKIIYWGLLKINQTLQLIDHHNKTSFFFILQQ